MPRLLAPMRLGVAFVLPVVLYANANGASFIGTGTGAIPDGTDTATCNASTIGAPRLVSFNVSGLAFPVSTVGVRVQFSPAHTHVSDLHMVLAAPASLRLITLFGDTGTDGRGGAAAHVSGPYLFADNQTGDWWAAAVANNLGTAIPSGGYRTSGEGTATFSSLNATFGGLVPAQANGLWTLQINDDCAGDTGGISSAELLINDASLPVRLETYSID